MGELRAQSAHSVLIKTLLGSICVEHLQYAVAGAWSCLPSLCTSSGRAQAARQRVQCVAGEANRMDDDDQSVDMDKLVFRPNPERLGLELSHSDDEE